MTELMTFREHMQELYKKAILLFIIFIILEISMMTFSMNALSFLSEKFSLISITPLDVFNSSVMISFIFSLLILYPVGSWLIISYLKPAFSNIMPVVKLFIISSVLFYAGFFFGIAVFTSFMVLLAKQFSVSMGITTMWGVTPFIKFILFNGLIFALMFQLPLIVHFGLKSKLISPEKLTKNSWVAVPVIFVVSGWLTPPDPVSVFIMAIPLCIMFYVSIFVCVKLNKSRLNKSKVN